MAVMLRPAGCDSDIKSQRRLHGCIQERTAKRVKLKEEHATAYIEAGTLPDGGEDTAPMVTDITKDAKVPSQ